MTALDRRDVELSLLREQLPLKIREAFDGDGSPTASVSQLRAFADRLEALAGDDAELSSLAADARRAAADVDGAVEPPPSSGPFPSWSEVELAANSWLAKHWKCDPLRFHKTAPGGAGAQVQYQVLVDAYVVAGYAKCVQLRLGLVRSDEGWIVGTVAVGS